MPKQSQLPQDAAPSLTDRLTGLQIAATLAVTYTLQTLITFFWTLANIPAGATSPITRDSESQFPFVASGMVWTADAAGSTRNASMTAGVCYINGRRISIAAVTARTFTASVDTYIDILDNGDGTGTLVYTTASNNAASPALAANSLRIGIIVTGTTNIAAATSINQGQLTMVLPIASSIPYTLTDSLGNLICCRDPQQKLIGYRQIISNFTATTVTDITGLNFNANLPANRKVKATGYIGSGSASVTNNAVSMLLLDVTAVVTLASTSNDTNASGDVVSVNPVRLYDGVASGFRNFKAQLNRGSNAATANTNSSGTNPSYIALELE